MINKIKRLLNRHPFLVKRTILTVAVLLVFLPAIVLGLQIYKQSSNVPYMDQWELVWDFQKIDSGDYGVNDLWRQHNEHRLLFPRLVMIVGAHLTQWNVRYEMAVSFVLTILCLAVFYLILKKQRFFKSNGWLFFLTMLAISVMLFSFSQAENWLWGWQLQWMMTCLGVVTVIWALMRKQLNPIHYWLAILAATIATYSLGSGQFIWPIGLFLLYMFGNRLRYWLIATLVVLATYYYSYSKIGSPLTPHDIITKPLEPIKYFFLYLGRPLTENIHYAFVIGFVSVTLFIVCILITYKQNKGNLKEKLQTIALPVALGGFALLSAAATTISRTSFGLDQALSSRYITISTFFWIALIIVFISAAYSVSNKKHYLLITTNFLCIFLAVAIASSNRSTIFFSQHAGMLENIEICTKQIPAEDACLKSAYPRVDKIQQDTEYLRDKQWAGY